MYIREKTPICKSAWDGSGLFSLVKQLLTTLVTSENKFK